VSSPSCPGVLLANLGTPNAPNPGAVRRYLRSFLSDRRIVDAPRLPWWLLLNLVILPRRSPRSAALYRKIWTPEGSPILVISRRQARGLEELLLRRLGRHVPVALGMRHGSPSLATGLRNLHELRCSPIIVLPLYPQCSGTTVGSIFDAAASEISTWRHVPELRFLSGYHEEPAYISALASSVRDSWERNGRSRRLLISFHGIPERYAAAGDPYPSHCAATSELLARELGLTEDQWRMTYQSRFGRAPWLGPATADVLEEWGGEGLESVDVLCPGFAADCLETLEEIALNGRDRFQEAGGGVFHYIPALNDRPDHLEALAALVKRAV